MNKDNGGPAFPVLDYRTPDRAEHKCDGMTLRDYFAAKAMQAMVAAPTYEIGRWAQDDIASQAYEMADAMLAERAK